MLFLHSQKWLVLLPRMHLSVAPDCWNTWQSLKTVYKSFSRIKRNRDRLDLLATHPSLKAALGPYSCKLLPHGSTLFIKIETDIVLVKIHGLIASKGFLGS